MAREQRRRQALRVLNRNAAGIDIGSNEHWVAVPPDRDPEPVRRFAAFTADLVALADWLRQCGVTSVVMEATGVYWIPLFQILETRGFEVKLVNAKHVRHVPGRKSDQRDCQWLQELHSYGLLSASFRPENDICVLRAYLRHRDNVIRAAKEALNFIDVQPVNARYRMEQGFTFELNLAGVSDEHRDAFAGTTNTLLPMAWSA